MTQDSYQPPLICQWVFQPATQFSEGPPISLKYAILDAFRCSPMFLQHARDIGAIMELWLAAASALPYTDTIGQGVVDTLLQMASNYKLRSHIPVLAWHWLKRQPVLGPDCQGLKCGTTLSAVVLMVRNLQDAGLFTSYLLVVWSEWSDLDELGCRQILHLIRGELCGAGAAGYRADLIKRLDYILAQLGSRSSKKQWYEEFRRVLLEVDEEAMTQS